MPGLSKSVGVSAPDAEREADRALAVDLRVEHAVIQRKGRGRVDEDAGTVGFVAEMEAGIARGVLADADPTLARLLGRPTTPVADGLRAAVAASRVNA